MPNEILLLAIKQLTINLEELIKACLDENGKARTPTMKDIMQARACLPKGYEYTLVKERIKNETK